jgi:GT2 family glycosyltransferase
VGREATESSPATISVVIPSYRAEGTIVRTLEALARQNAESVEVIVIDSSPGDAVERLVTTRFPRVRFEWSPRRLAPHEARNRGAELATGEIIVFTDPDCEARPDWLASLLSARAAGHEVVGGAVEPADRRWLAYGMHLCKFGPWLSGGAVRTEPILPTANQSWSRAAWERVGPFAVLGWSGDTDLCWRAGAAGYELLFEPRAVVEHHEEATFFSFLGDRVRRGRAYAAVRNDAQGWSRTRAALQLIAAPVVPALLLLRGLRRAARVNRIRQALAASPILLAGYSAWSLGEARTNLERAFPLAR